MIDIDYYKTIAGGEGVTFEMKIALRDLITDVEERLKAIQVPTVIMQTADVNSLIEDIIAKEETLLDSKNLTISSRGAVNYCLVRLYHLRNKLSSLSV